MRGLVSRHADADWAATDRLTALAGGLNAFVAAVCVLQVVAMAGCASSWRQDLRSQAVDLLDVFAVELTAGPGADIHANATRWLGAAMGYSNQSGLLIHGRHRGFGTRQTFGMLFAGYSVACLELPETAPRMGKSYAGRGGVWRLFVCVSGDFLAGPTVAEPSAWDFDLGVSAIVGIHFGVNPAEFLDFALGFVGIDLAGDDGNGAPSGTGPPAPG